MRLQNVSQKLNHSLTRSPLGWLLPGALVLGAAVYPVAIASAPAHAPDSLDLTGQWSLHNSIEGNESDEDCAFTQADNKITGSCKTSDQTMKVTGSLDGKKVSFQYDAEYQGSTLTLTYNATVDNSESFSGTVYVDPYSVSGQFTAKRPKSSK